MRRAISILLIFLLSFSLFAEPIEFEYEPYEEDEFPVWLSEIRRAESIFFGSMVITFPLPWQAIPSRPALERISRMISSPFSGNRSE